MELSKDHFIETVSGCALYGEGEVSPPSSHSKFLVSIPMKFHEKMVKRLSVPSTEAIWSQLAAADSLYAIGRVRESYFKTKPSSPMARDPNFYQHAMEVLLGNPYKERVPPRHDVTVKLLVHSTVSGTSRYFSYALLDCYRNVIHEDIKPAERGELRERDEREEGEWEE